MKNPLFFLVRAALLLLGLAASTVSADEVIVVGVPSDELDVGDSDGWDLSVVLTEPVVGPNGAVDGVVTAFSYYAQPKSGIAEDYTVTPLLIKQQDDVWTVEGIGEPHTPDEEGAQEDIPFVAADGSASFSNAQADITYHIAFLGQQPDGDNDVDGGIVPFGTGGPGMFGMNTAPDTEFSPGDEFSNGHASDDRNYQFNFQIKWLTEDVDEDEMLDAWELTHGLDPADAADAALDKDNDGSTNLQEFNKGTNPTKEDTDGDGIKDGAETGTGVFVDAENTGTKPLLVDSDGDSLPDGVETATGVFVGLADSGTDPNKSDSDGDGYEDGTEIELNTDPTDPASVPKSVIIDEGREDWDSDGTVDGWDLTVVLTTPIETPAGFETGVAEQFSYFAGDQRSGDTESYTVAPILVEYDIDGDEWRLVGIGEAHSAEESGPQGALPFVVAQGTNVIDATREDVSYHVGFFNGHIDGDPDSNGGIVPFGGSGGPGMFGYNSAPDEEFEEGQILDIGHESGAGGRDYSFSIAVAWGEPPRDVGFQISEISVSEGAVGLTWSSKEGIDYAVEYKKSLEDPVWIELDDGVASDGELTSFVDQDAGRTGLPEGYYRVREN